MWRALADHKPAFLAEQRGNYFGHMDSFFPLSLLCSSIGELQRFCKGCYLLMGWTAAGNVV